MTAHDPPEFVQEWYRSQCDGDWEHEFGVAIDTLDNPGWRLDIDIQGTELEDKAFEVITANHSEDVWCHVWCDGKQFHGAGGPSSLGQQLTAFQNFVESGGTDVGLKPTGP